MATFPLELVTPERKLFSEEVQMVRVPGVEGSLGILAGHAPLLTELTTGLIKLTLADGQTAYIATSGGFMQVSREKVIILADSAELSEEIDVDRAREAAEKARQMLAVEGINAEEVRQQLERAENRIKVAQQARHQQF
ncbi:MAG TPA: F0F1 ATP synthase subunit epsilon [Chthonomonadaceae bacterium]|nr:F0F1 ATP synthase subunit epsilon [Chthonomonadaceae bacterium]